MKKRIFKFKLFILAMLYCYLISSSSIFVPSTRASITEIHNNSTINSFDRYGWRWNLTEDVSSVCTEDSIEAEIALDNFGNIHIVWQEYTDYAGAGSDMDIFYRCWDASSSLWKPVEVVSTESTGASGVPSITTDSNGFVHVVWLDLTDYTGCGTDIDVFYKYKDSFTQTWSITEVVSIDSTSMDTYEPRIAVDSMGNIHILWQDDTDILGSGSDTDIFYRFWNSSSHSWGSTELVSTESTGSSDYPSIAVDCYDKVHVCWPDITDILGAGTDRDIFYKSRDLTSLWTTTELVSNESTSSANYPSLGADMEGNIHVVWDDMTQYDGSGDDRDIFYKYRDSYTGNWSLPEVVSTELSEDAFMPSLTIDLCGNILITWCDWTDYRNSGLSDCDIFYRCLERQNSLWSPIHVVSSESTGDAYFPDIAVDYEGFVHIVWEDDTDYSSSGSDSDIFYKLLAWTPSSPNLAFVVPNPTEMSTVYLEWSGARTATNYYVYRSISYIYSIEGMMPIATTSASEYIDTLPSEGVYYYAIIAENYVGKSSLSNCRFIEYIMPTLQEFLLISSMVFGSIISVSVVSLIRRKKSN